MGCLYPWGGGLLPSPAFHKLNKSSPPLIKKTFTYINYASSPI